MTVSPPLATSHYRPLLSSGNSSIPLLSLSNAQHDRMETWLEKLADLGLIQRRALPKLHRLPEAALQLVRSRIEALGAGGEPRSPKVKKSPRAAAGIPQRPAAAAVEWDDDPFQQQQPAVPIVFTPQPLPPKPLFDQDPFEDDTLEYGCLAPAPQPALPAGPQTRQPSQLLVEHGLADLFQDFDPFSASPSASIVHDRPQPSPSILRKADQLVPADSVVTPAPLESAPVGVSEFEASFFETAFAASPQQQQLWMHSPSSTSAAGSSAAELGLFAPTPAAAPAPTYIVAEDVLLSASRQPQPTVDPFAEFSFFKM